ncbi:tetratricopeptide repeat protein [Cytobacillus purgationiresistens]|uniref:Tetratricopeptide (TPR) repeat protein n=1 Tax=Cytobacillus purgationiresistens TaxID=863449 RepID=A0ABU0AFI1_9BACI|nr:tetratricopeptide repeat protein [Cytobacillus purgationiresistens]MDQ0270017.1 tetratricopeptide (TPR) repeat protein [Cytobacillus purgationiresistens]
MRKREKHKREDKVIRFPDLEKRLLERGLESLQEKKFKDAIHFLEEALSISSENEEANIALVLAYFETGDLTPAKEHAERMLQTGIGDYIQVIDIYLMILIQLHQYEEIVTVIEGLMEDKEVPKEKFEHFNRLLEFSRRMSESAVNKGVEEEFEEEDDADHSVLDLQSITNQKDQLIVAGQLANRNIAPLIEDIQAYLMLSNGQPFFKTLLINVMKEHAYNKEVTVGKMDKNDSFVPEDLPEIDEIPQQKNIENILKEQVENDDPVLYEHIRSIIERHFFMMFPFNLDGYEDEVWAASYHFLAAEYLGFDDLTDEMVNLYNISKEELHEALAYIKKIEEFSYSKI